MNTTTTTARRVVTTTTIGTMATTYRAAHGTIGAAIVDMFTAAMADLAPHYGPDEIADQIDAAANGVTAACKSVEDDMSVPTIGTSTRKHYVNAARILATAGRLTDDAAATALLTLARGFTAHGLKVSDIPNAAAKVRNAKMADKGATTVVNAAKRRKAAAAKKTDTTTATTSTTSTTTEPTTTNTTTTTTESTPATTPAPAPAPAPAPVAGQRPAVAILSAIAAAHRTYGAANADTMSGSEAAEIRAALVAMLEDVDASVDMVGVDA